MDARSFVARRVYAAFCDALKPLAEAAKRQSLALPAQAEQARRLVADALEKGARRLASPDDELGADGMTPAYLAAKIVKAIKTNRTETVLGTEARRLLRFNRLFVI